LTSSCSLGKVKLSVVGQVCEKLNSGKKRKNPKKYLINDIKTPH